MDWKAEARAVIEDIKQDVKEIAVSDKLPGDDNGIYLNVETLDRDENRFCVRMSALGFEIVGREYDQVAEAAEEDQSVIYETPYALLSAISKSYSESFANRLCAALKKIPAE